MVGPETPSEPHVIEKGLSFDVNPSNGMPCLVILRPVTSTRRRLR
jgi:hypothetical protein